MIQRAAPAAAFLRAGTVVILDNSTCARWSHFISFFLRVILSIFYFLMAVFYDL